LKFEKLYCHRTGGDTSAAMILAAAMRLGAELRRPRPCANFPPRSDFCTFNHFVLIGSRLRRCAAGKCGRHGLDVGGHLKDAVSRGVDNGPTGDAGLLAERLDDLGARGGGVAEGPPPDPALEPGEEPLTCGGCSFFGRKDGRGFCTLRIFYVDAQERGCEFFDPMLSDASYT